MEILDAGRDLRRRPSAGDDSLRRQRDGQLRARTAAADASSARSRKPGSSSGCAARKRPGRSGATRSGTLDMRADPQNLPAGLTQAWPGAGYAGFGGGDHSSAYVERAEIYDSVRDARHHRIRDRRRRSPQLLGGPGREGASAGPFEPVGVAFITGSISAPGLVEAFEHRFPKDHPLRPLFLGQGPADTRPQPTVNLLLRHGVRSCLEYAKSGDITKARALSNPDLSPHLSFVDMGGHGYTTVRVTSDALETEFVCIPRPLERSENADGGPINYRMKHRAALWVKSETPKLEAQIVEGDPRFSL